MTQEKQNALAQSGEAAVENFGTNNRISGGCATCACEILINYEYDSGDPVPDAQFVLTDSKNTKIEGKTDENGKVFIYNMGCGAFEILLGEGSDKFVPTEKIKNNPVIQSSPENAALAGEYFALYVEMRKLNLVVYDQHSQLAAGLGIMHSIPPQYKPAYERFCVLVRKIRRGDPAFRKEIGRIHNSISAEVATLAQQIDSAVLLMGEIILGCIPVVGSAIDAICIAEWCYSTYQKPALLDDPMHQMDGVFCAIGVIPGLGDAMKISGRAITDAMRKVKTGSPEKIQEAIKLIRGLSNGNIVKWIAKMRSEMRNYADEAKVILTKMKVALQKVINESSLGNNWIITLMKDTFHKMVEYLGKLFDLVDATVTLIDSELVAFIPNIMTQAVGSARAKGTCSASGLEIEKGASGDYRTEEESNEDVKRTKDTGLTNSAVGIAAAMAAVGFGRVRGGRHATAASGTHKASPKTSHAQTSSQHGKSDTAKTDTPSTRTETAPAHNKASGPATQHSPESPGDKAQTTETPQTSKGKKKRQKKRQDSGAQDIKARSKKETRSTDPKDKDKANQQDKETNGNSKTAEENGDPVNMATGAVVERRTDLQLAGLLPLSLARFYRSTGERHPGLLGDLWRSNWDISLELDGSLATLTDGEFNRAVFVLPGEGEVNRAPSNPEWRLTREQNQLIVRHVGGLRYRFEHALGMQLCLTAIEDPAGNRVNFEWEFTELRWISLPDGRFIHVLTEQQRIVKLTLCSAQRQPIKTLARYTYDEQGHLLSVRASEGRNFDYQYSPQGWLLRWSDLGTTWVEHDYDDRGRAIRDRTSDGYWAGHFEYDDANLTSYYHSGFGGVTRYVRDARNNILIKCMPDGGETHFEWVDNQLIAETDPLGQRTVYERNAWGQPTTVTLPDGAIHRYEYDDAGQLLAYFDPLGNTWRYQRNALGQIVEVNDPEQREWFYRYNATGQLDALIGPDGVLQHYRYNRRGLLSGIERDNTPTATFLYDDVDRLTERHIAHETGVQIRRWEYEGTRDTPAKVVYEDGSETRFGYDVEGNLTAVTDALGQRYQFRYGAFDNLLEATDPLGATVRYHYNAQAEFAGVTNSLGREWTYGFDHCGRLNEERHYDGRIYRYHYDVAGRLTQRLAPDGSHMLYAYDAAGRITEIVTRRVSGDSEAVTELHYDLAGRLIKAANPDAVVEYAYNRAGQVIAETVNGEVLTSDYDASGQRARVEGILAPLQLAWASGRVTALGIGTHQPLQFSHTASGEEQRRSNGSGFALRQEWSPTGLLQRQALEGADGRVNDVLERHYQYDVLDRLTGISDSHWGEQAFRLNGTGQVTAERREEGRRRQARLFGYDSEQNLCEIAQIAPGMGEALTQKDAVVQSLARYDAAGRIIERGYTHYRYDDCGRLVLKRETRPGFRPKETHYEWDVQDRLVRVSLPEGARWRYRYDAFGRRVSKVREGQASLAQAVARVAYRWDGDQLVGQQQYLADGTAARAVQWVYEPGSFRPLAQVEEKGDVTRLHYIVTDLTGTARELCSEEGEVHWRGEQALWGNHREERRPIALRRYLGDASNEEVYCELRYQGQLYDAETGLYYNRHRYYDADSGQYLSPDPIGLNGGIRPQGYVTNPFIWIDPLGLSTKEPRTNTYKDIETPYGSATQSMDPAALAAREKVEGGAILYRVGTTGRSETEGAQFWALEHPHSPGYANRYGIPQENIDRSNFITTARLKPGADFITRPAPGIGDNLGGGIEVVVPKDAVSFRNFSLF